MAQSPALPIITTRAEGDTAGAYCQIIEYFIFTPVITGNQLTFPLKEIVGEGASDTALIDFYKVGYQNSGIQKYQCSIEIKDDDNNVISTASYEKQLVGTTWSHSGTESVTLTPTDGTYTVTYSLYKNYQSIGIRAWADIVFIFAATENRLPLKKWTITDVIVRACDLIEPLMYGEKPRFRFDGVSYNATTGNANTTYASGSQAEEFDKIISPEFAFTKMTFREQMRMIGGFIHGEPRITGFDVENGKRYYTFKFDKYGGIEKSNLKNIKPYVTAGFNTDINEFCTSLDSSADNLINQLDWAQGVIVEPFLDYGQSFRSQSVGLRLDESNDTVIKTVLPLYQTGEDFRVYAVYIPTMGFGKWDITPYIFEKADYDNLSSYSGSFPYAKCFALYYTQGEKSIKGAFFKSEHAISGYFNNYAILNILRAVTGNNALTLDPETEGNTYMDIAFQVEYLPIYGERVRTNKACVVKTTPRTLAYNQNANLIEARYYGENLKGVVARLGNVEKTYTYNLAFFSDIPKAGMLYDDNYYISAVNVEILPTYIKCTVGLSKDFNRLSEYVGINSEKRMWEVSEKQSIKRDSIIRDYLVFSKTADYSGNSGHFRTTNIDLNTLFNSAQWGLVTSAKVERRSKNNNSLSNDLLLPVVSSCSGNSMLFTFGFEDNYSAGQKISWVDREESGNTHGISGYWADYIPYNDYYGRFYWLGFALYFGKITLTGGNYNDVPQIGVENTYNNNQKKLIDCLYYSGNNKQIRYRKDNREVPQITYELTAVSDTEDIIIGSALMRNCQFINRAPSSIKLYVFSEKLNRINSKIPDNPTEITAPTITVSSITFPSYSGEYAAWGICTVATTETIDVEDEDGNETTQSIIKGGELLIGGNGQMPEHLYAIIKGDIYE